MYVYSMSCSTLIILLMLFSFTSRICIVLGELLYTAQVNFGLFHMISNLFVSRVADRTCALRVNFLF